MAVTEKKPDHPARIKLANPGLLTWARETAGYQLSDIAHSLDKQEEDIAKWEKGIDYPTYRQLEEFANKVKRPVAAFFRSNIPIEHPIPKDFRTLSGVASGEYKSETLIAFREARSQLSETRELLGALDLELVFSLPAFELASDPEKEAGELREKVGISMKEQRKCSESEAFDIWRDAFFDFGVVSMVFSMPMRDARAFCLIDEDNELAAVGLNSNELGFGRVFSLIHEVAHLCLREPGVSGESDKRVAKTDKDHVERFCNRFAANLLLPADDSEVEIQMHWLRGHHSRADFEDVAKKIKVSKQVVLRRALDLEYISWNFYNETYRAWNAVDSKLKKQSAGGGGIFPILSRIGRRFAGLVFDALDSGKISIYDASKLLSLDQSHFPEARTHILRRALRAR